MKLSFTQEEVDFISKLIREPSRLPLQLAGIERLYQAKDYEGSKQLYDIKTWLEMKVLKKKEAGEGFAAQAWEGQLRDSFISRLLSCFEHYELVGRTAFGDWPKLYWNIRRKLEGKAEMKYEDPEEPAEAEKKPG